MTNTEFPMLYKIDNEKYHTDYAIKNVELSSESIQKLGLQSVQEFLVSLPSKNSRKSMYRYTQIIAHTLGFSSIENFNFALFKENIIRGLVSAMQQKYSPATIKTCMAAVKGIAFRLKVNNVLTEQEYTLIKAIKPGKGSRINVGRALSDEELHTIFSSLDQEKNVKAVRDAAILSVLVMCGLRRSECASLKMSNLYLQEDVPYLKIIGKGNKERICFIPEKTLARLNSWLEERGHEDGSLFLRIHKNGEIINSGMTDQAIYNISKDRGKKSNVLDWSTHDLRRTYATKLLDLQVDLSTVKDMMGHSSIQTTIRYDKRGIDKMKKALSVLNNVNK